MFELHFDGGFQIGPKTIGRREERELDEDVEDADLTTGDEATGRRIRLGPPLAALAVAVGLGLGARRLMDRGDDAQMTLDDEELMEEGDDIDVEA